MADDNKRLKNDPQDHTQAKSQSSGNTDKTDEHKRAGEKGGKASQDSGNAHQLTNEEKNLGGQMSSSKQDMSEPGRKGGSQ